jgi:HAD superfamily hydrolase (TIGR01484 family)
MSSMIRLLSTDFDGTLVDHFAPTPVAPALFETLLELRRCGVLWAINTGRDLGLTLEGLQEFQFPLAPDYILTNEREVYHRDPEGKWRDYGDWNRRCTEAHDALFEQEFAFVGEMLRFLEAETNAQPIYENDRPVGVVAASDEEMDRVIEFLVASRTPDSRFHYQSNTIYLRLCHQDYSKGAALGELCRLTGITPLETFTAGDHHNDLSMLDGRFARWPTAPGNAIDQVKSTVQQAGGYVATARCSHGVVEALRYFFKEHQLTPPDYRG